MELRKIVNHFHYKPVAIPLRPSGACWLLRTSHAKENLMADDLKQTGRPDDGRINVDQDHELTYWSKTLGVSRDRLREVVAKVGPLRQNVEKELRG
jgi:hypothetical protein